MKVFLLDDSPLFLRKLKKFLSGLPGIKIIGEARNPLKAIGRIKKLKPDAVIVDMKIYKILGIDILKNIRKIRPIPKIIMLTNELYRDYNEKLDIKADFFIDKFTEMNRITELLKLIA